MARRHVPEVVYVERGGGGDSSVKSLLWGMAIGGALAMLYAPRSGEETRRSLQRSLWKLRAMTEEKLDELVQQYGPGQQRGGALAGDAYDRGYGDDALAADPEAEEYGDEEFDDMSDLSDEGPAAGPVSAREELERRLAEARARRRGGSTDYEEPLA
jgi:hypothetical protein